MEPPRLFKETTPAGKLLSIRWHRLHFDYMQKPKDFTLWQMGRGRKRFICRVSPDTESPPVFLLNLACHVRWTIGDFYIGATTKPISLDNYWRSKGWMTSTHSINSNQITNGTDE